MAGVSLVKLPSDEDQQTLSMISQYLPRSWLGAIRQQAITWANIDPNLCRHVMSLGHNELMSNNEHLILTHFALKKCI